MPRWKINAASGYRKHPTAAEAALWEELRGTVDWWHHQWPMLGYIADFYSGKRRLVVEVDGAVHRNHRRDDATRDAAFRRHGFTILHFTNEQVLWDMPTTLSRIREHGATLEARTSPPRRSRGSRSTPA